MNSVLSKIQSTDGILPETVIEYVSKSMPGSTLNLGGWRIFGGMSFISENYHASPSMFIRQFGHWTIARLDNGDAACLDSNSGMVRIFDTGAFTGKKDNQGFVMIRSQVDIRKPMKEPCSADNVFLFVKRTFDSLADFINELEASR